MTIFENVKSAVTPRMAVEHCGLQVSHGGMICCPFHDDRHPSMKLYDDHFHCFGCQENGDVIKFTEKLLGLTPLDAAQKLAANFGIREGKPSVLAKLNRHKTRVENERLCFRVLCDYLHILEHWKAAYTPRTPEDKPDPRFIEACHQLERTQYFIDILTEGEPENRTELVQDLMTDSKIIRLQEQVKQIKEEMNEQK